MRRGWDEIKQGKDPINAGGWATVAQWPVDRAFHCKYKRSQLECQGKRCGSDANAAVQKPVRRLDTESQALQQFCRWERCTEDRLSSDCPEGKLNGSWKTKDYSKNVGLLIQGLNTFSTLLKKQPTQTTTKIRKTPVFGCFYGAAGQIRIGVSGINLVLK